MTTLSQWQLEVERQAFEAWARSKDWNITRSMFSGIEYAAFRTEIGWLAWQARATPTDRRTDPNGAILGRRDGDPVPAWLTQGVSS